MGASVEAMGGGGQWVLVRRAGVGASVEGWGGGGQWVLVWRPWVGEDSGC